MSVDDEPGAARNVSGDRTRAPGPVPDLRMPATALTVLFALAAAVTAASAAAYANRASVVSDALGMSPEADLLASNVAVDADRLTRAYDLVGLGTWAYGVVGLALGVFFIIWQYRHAQNARLLGSRSALGPGWAIGGWFVPLANFVLPVRQLWTASRSSNPDGRGAGIVVAWWVAFVAAILIDRTAAQLGVDGPRDDPTVRDLANADWLAAGGEVVFAAAAVLGLIMVRRLTAAQGAALAATGGAVQPGPPAPPPPPAP
ncbi:DUF4328 domain-containing protein [Jiangella muralis]|uniref:DUF4328 domain-containing protein n=1 Tax=Jiangella muralis TaxID=702383 RepID=UPI000AEAB462|nr:DUF4328 domain-containing protein [Jiangella muralis]